MGDQPLAADLAEPDGGAEPECAGEVVEAVAKRHVAVGGDGQVADFVVDGPSGVAGGRTSPPAARSERQTARRRGRASRPPGRLSPRGSGPHRSRVWWWWSSW